MRARQKLETLLGLPHFEWDENGNLFYKNAKAYITSEPIKSRYWMWTLHADDTRKNTLIDRGWRETKEDAQRAAEDALRKILPTLRD